MKILLDDRYSVRAHARAMVRRTFKLANIVSGVSITLLTNTNTEKKSWERLGIVSRRMCVFM